MEVEIKNIEAIENPRKDFNEKKLIELTESIKSHGILENLGVVEIADRKGHYELVYGERRLKAATLAGLKTVPVVVVHLDPLLAHLIENLHRHDLNPMEEAIAFKRLVDRGRTNGVNAAHVGKEVNKTELYVQRRLELLNCTQKVQNALREGKIMLGHALAIARSRAKEQDAVLKEVISERLDVKSTHWRVSRKSAKLENAIFSRKDCIGCKFNGGEQTILYETGTQLKGVCMNTKCFIKKTNEKIKKEKATYEKIKVVLLQKKKIEAMAGLTRVYGRTKIEVKKDMKKHPEDYRVCLEHDYKGIPELVVFKKEGRAIPKTGGKPQDPKVAEAALKNRITEFKRQLLIRENKKILTVDSVKRISLHFLIQELPWGMKEALGKKLSKGTGTFPAILGMEEAELQEFLADQSRLRIKELRNSELQDLADHSGMQIRKVFKLNDTFLNLHTIPQLKVLAGELGVSLESKKKTDIVQEILKDKVTVKKIPESMLLKLKRF